MAFEGIDLETEALKVRRLLERGVDAIALVGPEARVLDHLQRWTSGIANYLIVRGRFEALRTVIETGRFE